MYPDIMLTLSSLNSDTLTIESIVWAAATWEAVATVVRHWLHSFTTLHQQRAGNVGTHTLVRDTAIAVANFHDYRVVGTVEGELRTIARHSAALFKVLITV